MRVLVAGATGTLGLALTRQLLAADHQVVGLTRTPRGAATLRNVGAEVVLADLMDMPALLAGIDRIRADAVIHQATAITRAPTRHRHLYATNELRSRGTANLMAVAERIGARRFLTQSFLFGYGYRDHGAVPLTEEAPFGQPGRGAFDRHLRAMRSNEAQVLGSDRVEGIALRYGVFYGDEPSTVRLFDQVERHRLPVPGRSGTVSFVHVEDAAAATVAALERGRGGQAYNVADAHPVTWTAYLRTVAEAAGVAPPRSVPAWLLRLSPYMGTVMVRSSLRLDSRKAREELGWVPRYETVADGLAEVARRRGRGRIGGDPNRS